MRTTEKSLLWVVYRMTRHGTRAGLAPSASKASGMRWNVTGQDITCLFRQASPTKVKRNDWRGHLRLHHASKPSARNRLDYSPGRQSRMGEPHVTRTPGCRTALQAAPDADVLREPAAPGDSRQSCQSQRIRRSDPGSPAGREMTRVKWPPRPCGGRTTASCSAAISPRVISRPPDWGQSGECVGTGKIVGNYSRGFTAFSVRCSLK